MTIYNLGSINIDHIYHLPHHPRPGETLASTRYAVSLGGKGANQSVAAGRAGGHVVHIGAIGAGKDDWICDQMAEHGVDVSQIARSGAVPTGHAIILLSQDGENSIVLLAGANRRLNPTAVTAALSPIGTGDTLLLQNETNLQAEAAGQAREAGARVIYSAAPFEVEAVAQILPHVSILAMNDIEAQALFAAMGRDLPVDGLLVTRGADGADYIDVRTGQTTHQPAFAVEPVDTTGAGDCFLGFFAAALDRGETVAEAMRQASAAAAIQVTRPGAAVAMPERAEVFDFLIEQGAVQPSA